MKRFVRSLLLRHLSEPVYKQLRSEEVELFNPAIVQQRESFGRVCETLQEPWLLGECFTKLELKSAGNISAQRQHVSYISPTPILLESSTNNEV
jgi:hypothetical protein